MKRGQISLFIIIGMFILGGALFFLFLKGEQEREIRNTLGQITPVRDSLLASLDNCVQGHVDVVLRDLFKQGGVLFEEQGGVISESDIRTSVYDDAIVRYGILKDSEGYDVPVNFKPDNLVPPFNSVTGLFTETSAGSIYAAPAGLFNRQEFMQFPFFGNNVLFPLCDRYGPNGVNVSDTAFSCHPALYGDGVTIQSQLNRALTQRLRSCTENVALQERYALDTLGSGNVSVIFGERDILVDIDLSILYYYSGADRSIPSLQFSYPYRVKQLYSFGYLIAREDTRDIFFDKSVSYVDVTGCLFTGSSRCWDESITVIIKRGVSGTSDFVSIEDRNTRLGTLPLADPFLRFQFFVENRRPYLEYISNKSIVTTQNAKLEIPLIFKDPDEEATVTYRVHRLTNSLGVPVDPQYFDPVSKAWRGDESIPSLNFSLSEQTEISCDRYCKGVPGSSPTTYYLTRHFFIAEILDRGALSDYQIFSVTIEE
jgi:hypothetical protein